MTLHRNHIEARSSKTPARQYVSETHDHKPDAPSKAAHTAGPVIVEGETHDIHGRPLWCGAVLPVGRYRGPVARIQSCDHIDGISNYEASANAHLIADAFNVAHETGLTPRELAANRDRLREAMKGAAAIANIASKEIAELKAQRDELLGIIRDSVEILPVALEAREATIGEQDDVLRDLIARHGAAIAKVEGGAA